MYSKRWYKSFIFSVILEELKAFRNQNDLSQYYFSENFMYNVTFYESENFNYLWFLSSSHFQLVYQKILGFVFLKKPMVSKIWKIKLKKILWNLLDKLRKL